MVKHPIRSGYLATLSLVTLLIIFGRLVWPSLAKGSPTPSKAGRRNRRSSGQSGHRLARPRGRIRDPGRFLQPDDPGPQRQQDPGGKGAQRTQQEQH
jgi:hypothetical protein